MSCRIGLSVLMLTMGLAGVASAQEAESMASSASARRPAPENNKKARADEKEEAKTAPDASPNAPKTRTPKKATATATAATPEADKPVDKDEGLPPRVPWRGTNLEYINAATTAMLGVGQDYQSDDFHSYSMYWRATLQYYLVDQEAWSFRLRSRPTLYVELTNSDTTTTEREPQFLDLDLVGLFGHKLYAKDLWATNMTYTTGFIFPTWKNSYGVGNILTTTNRVALSQDFQVAGPDAPVLKSLNVTGLFRWDHRFSRATTAVNDNVEVRRLIGLSQTSTVDNTLSNGRLARETLQEILSVGFSEAIAGMPLNIGFDFIFSQQFKPALLPEGQCVPTLTGPACVDPQDDDFVAYYYGFSPSIEFIPIPELGISFSYSSSSSPLGQNTLREDGRRRNFGYAPDAEFSLSLTFNPDALYERATGPKRKLAQGKKKTVSF